MTKRLDWKPPPPRPCKCGCGKPVPTKTTVGRQKLYASDECRASMRLRNPPMLHSTRGAGISPEQRQCRIDCGLPV